MSNDLPPLFVAQVQGEKVAVNGNIKIDDEEYKAVPFITSIAEAIAESCSEVANAEEMGKLTIYGYILLETLHHMGKGTSAEMLTNDPSALYQASLACAIGVAAGQEIPKELVIDTVFGEDNDDTDSSSVREGREDGSGEED